MSSRSIGFLAMEQMLFDFRTTLIPGKSYEQIRPAISANKMGILCVLVHMSWAVRVCCCIAVIIQGIA